MPLSAIGIAVLSSAYLSTKQKLDIVQQNNKKLKLENQQISEEHSKNQTKVALLETQLKRINFIFKLSDNPKISEFTHKNLYKAIETRLTEGERFDEIVNTVGYQDILTGLKTELKVQVSYLERLNTELNELLNNNVIANENIKQNMSNISLNIISVIEKAKNTLANDNIQPLQLFNVVTSTSLEINTVNDQVNNLLLEYINLIKEDLSRSTAKVEELDLVNSVYFDVLQRTTELNLNKLNEYNDDVNSLATGETITKLDQHIKEILLTDISQTKNEIDTLAAKLNTYNNELKQIIANRTFGQKIPLTEIQKQILNIVHVENNVKSLKDRIINGLFVKTSNLEVKNEEHAAKIKQLEAEVTAKMDMVRDLNIEINKIRLQNHKLQSLSDEYKTIIINRLRFLAEQLKKLQEHLNLSLEYMADKDNLNIVINNNNNFIMLISTLIDEINENPISDEVLTNIEAQLSDNYLSYQSLIRKQLTREHEYKALYNEIKNTKAQLDSYNSITTYDLNFNKFYVETVDLYNSINKQIIDKVNLDLIKLNLEQYKKRIEILKNFSEKITTKGDKDKLSRFNNSLSLIVKNKAGEHITSRDFLKASYELELDRNLQNIELFDWTTKKTVKLIENHTTGGYRTYIDMEFDTIAHNFDEYLERFDGFIRYKGTYRVPIEIKVKKEFNATKLIVEPVFNQTHILDIDEDRSEAGEHFNESDLSIYKVILGQTDSYNFDHKLSSLFDYIPISILRVNN
ncbi:hypothetical protein ACJA23_00595 [Mycoplasma corogypsi]|uniref:hypothetical protein n=1 Tax=Mycoplasma corogypsi TaxID=2106 RepID=UPI003872AB88